MSILTFLHAAIVVTDLAASQKFYGELLGLSAVDRPLGFPGIWYQIGAVQLHLIQAEQVIPDLGNPEKWGRNQHLAFAVDNLEEMKQQLQQAGCPLQMSASGRAAIFVKDPDGNLIELSQG